MKRRALLLSITALLALCAACGWWLHQERQQYALNRALIDALKKNDFTTALALVNAGADPNTRQVPPPAPTLPQLLKHLLHHTPPANDSSTALILACDAGPRQWDSESGNAVSTGAQLALFQALLSHGANINARDNDIGTALNYAVLYRNPQLVELLLERGADPNVSDNEGTTPLMLAVTRGSTQEARLLLAHGANPNVQDEFGNTALYHTLLSSNPKDLIPDLLAHGAAPSLPNEQGRTPLQYAQHMHRPDLVSLLTRGPK